MLNFPCITEDTLRSQMATRVRPAQAHQISPQLAKSKNNGHSWFEYVCTGLLRCGMAKALAPEASLPNQQYDHSVD